MDRLDRIARALRVLTGSIPCPDCGRGGEDSVTLEIRAEDLEQLDPGDVRHREYADCRTCGRPAESIAIV